MLRLATRARACLASIFPLLPISYPQAVTSQEGVIDCFHEMPLALEHAVPIPSLGIYIKFGGWQQGEVNGAQLDMSFTTTAGFDAANLFLNFHCPLIQPDEHVGAEWTVTGENLGWTGSGTFSASLSNDQISGLIESYDFDVSFWSLLVGSLDSQFPFCGHFESLVYTIHVSPLVPGDLNGDARVDLADLGIILGNFGVSPAADVDCDDDTDLSDLGLVLANYGTSAVELAPQPGDPGIGAFPDGSVTEP